MSDKAVEEFAGGKHYSGATVERWKRSAARDGLLAVAERLRLGENQFRDVLDAVEDVAARRGCGADEVLALEPVADVLRERLGRSETLKSLKSALRRLRAPRLTAAEDRLAELARHLRLPRMVRVELPPHLDEAELTVIVRAGSAPELRSKLEATLEAARRPELDEMFRILDGSC